MNINYKVSRREFLRMAGLVALTTISGKFISACGPLIQNLGNDELVSPRQPVDLHINLKAQTDQTQIFSGQPTNVWRYSAEILSGNPSSIQTIPGSYLGPIIRAESGQRVKIDFENDLPEETIIHWHGMHVPAEMDGHPKDVIRRGNVFNYEYTISNRAGTYWYHPHPHGRTGPQVYAGLAGLLIVSDEEDQALGLPSGEFDIPMVIQDRTFDQDNQLVYLSNSMMGTMTGFLGNQILVNGFPDYSISVDRRAYRLRILNGSNSRIYKLAWDDGTPLNIIATDGGLLQKPISVPYVTLGPAERVEIWVNFNQWAADTEHHLISLPWAGNSTPGMQGMMGNSFSPIPDGTEFEILKVLIGEKSYPGEVLPDQLSIYSWLDELDSINRKSPRNWEFGMNRMQWTINNRTFEMEHVAKSEIVREGDQETWIIENRNSGMGMMGGMQMAHPVHIHGLQFQVIERQVEREFDWVWQSVAEGFLDLGWKDTILVMPGERVKVLIRFEDFEGLYLIHCHNLEHEDQGMMRNFLIKSA